MRAAFFETKKEEIGFLNENLKELEIDSFEEKLTEKNVEKVKDCKIISVWIYSKINKKILEKLKRLKLIVTRSTGFDHIDIESCKGRNISVCNIPAYGTATVAEHTFALILCLSRNIKKSIEKIENKDFSSMGLTGFELKGKTIGIIGCGNIGKNVAKIAKGFGMNIISYDVIKDEGFAKELGFKYVELNELLENSDVITLHLPYSKSTHHIINGKNIRMIKRGAILVNTARGGLIETNEVIDALERGILRGVGLDVLEKEKLSEKELKKVLSRLSKRDNVIITPHNAFNSRETSQEVLDVTVSNIKSFLKGRPQNTVSM